MKKRLFVCSVFALLLLSLTIMDSYGLFETNAGSKTVYEIGKWEILLNGEDVTLDREITLNDFTYTSDSHTESGYLSPGGSATLDLIIDATNVDTAFSYSISLDVSSIEEFPNLNMKVINLETNEEMENPSISGTIMLEDTERVKELRLILEWENVLEEDVNDVKVLDKNIFFPISMHFSQISEE